MTQYLRRFVPARGLRVPLAIVLGTYVLACLLPAGIIPGGSHWWEDSHPGWLFLVNGFFWFWIAVPGAAVDYLTGDNGGQAGQALLYTALNWTPWLANPVFAVAVGRFWRGDRTRVSILGAAATVLALSFLRTELCAERQCWILPAFYVWAACPALLAIFALMVRRRERQPWQHRSPLKGSVSSV